MHTEQEKEAATGWDGWLGDARERGLRGREKRVGEMARDVVRQFGGYEGDCSKEAANEVKGGSKLKR